LPKNDFPEHGGPPTRILIGLKFLFSSNSFFTSWMFAASPLLQCQFKSSTSPLPSPSSPSTGASGFAGAMKRELG